MNLCSIFSCLGHSSIISFFSPAQIYVDSPDFILSPSFYYYFAVATGNNSKREIRETAVAVRVS